MLSVDPFTDSVIGEVPEQTPGDVDGLLDSAAREFRRWRSSAVTDRCAALREVADLMAARKASLAALATLEMGKPIRESEAETDKCISACRWLADNGAGLLAEDTRVAEPGRRATVSYAPLGVVLGIMPWNFPFWQAVRFIAPAVFAGNCAVLRHASNVPQCALAVERLFQDAGLRCVSAIFVSSGRVSDVISDSRIAAVSLTGSSDVGSAVAGTAGAQLKPHVLELGGSDAFIVTEDVDLQTVVDAAVRARTLNAGQSCVAAKRFLVADRLFDDFVDGVRARIQALRLGDPSERGTDMGPLAMPTLAATIRRQLAESISAGGTLIATASEPRDTKSRSFCPPAVMTDVTPDMPVFAEETFGPVFACTRTPDDSVAIDLANTSRFGLGSSVWCRDLARAERVARQLDVGWAAINTRVSSDPALPFGGIKNSGYGREMGAEGVRQFSNIRTLIIQEALSSMTQ